MLKFKKGDEVVVTGFINSRAEELGTLDEVGIVEVADDSEIPYFVKLKSVTRDSGGLWFREDNLKSAKESIFYDGIIYSIGDVIERLDDCPYPIGSKHTIIRIHHSFPDCVIAVGDDGKEQVHCLMYVKKVDDHFEKHNPELNIGDEVLILEHPVLKHGEGIKYPESMQKEIGSKQTIVEIHEYGYRLSNHWSYEAKYLQKVANDISKSQLLKQEMVDGMINHHIQPIESDGGSSDYYFTKLPKWLINQIVETGGIEVKDIVQFVFDNDAHTKDIIKAQKRIIEQRKGGGKAGLKPLYDYNKIVFFAEDQLRVAKNNLDEKSE